MNITFGNNLTKNISLGNIYKKMNHMVYKMAAKAGKTFRLKLDPRRVQYTLMMKPNVFFIHR